MKVRTVLYQNILRGLKRKSRLDGYGRSVINIKCARDTLGMVFHVPKDLQGCLLNELELDGLIVIKKKHIVIK